MASSIYSAAPHTPSFESDSSYSMNEESKGICFVASSSTAARRFLYEDIFHIPKERKYRIYITILVEVNRTANMSALSVLRATKGAKEKINTSLPLSYSRRLDTCTAHLDEPEEMQSFSFWIKRAAFRVSCAIKTE